MRTLDALDGVYAALEQLRDTLPDTGDSTDAEIERLARAFCELNDDAQARFFCSVGAHAERWQTPSEFQWRAVGRHLRICKCSTDAGRNVVRQIAGALEEPK